MSVTLTDEARLEARVDAELLALREVIARGFAAIIPHLPEPAPTAFRQEMQAIASMHGIAAEVACLVLARLLPERD